MKVFNEEIEECATCPCLNHLDMDGSPYCNILQEDIRNTNNIYKDCPFNKPITKEVIEGFGFSKLQQYLLSHNGAYVLETDLEYPSVIGIEYKLDYLIEEYKNNRYNIFKIKHIEGASCEKANYESLVIDGIPIFIGTINNPDEFKFILKSLNIIE